jgi:hypothetical protein
MKHDHREVTHSHSSYKTQTAHTTKDKGRSLDCSLVSSSSPSPWASKIKFTQETTTRSRPCVIRLLFPCARLVLCWDSSIMKLELLFIERWRWPGKGCPSCEDLCWSTSCPSPLRRSLSKSELPVCGRIICVKVVWVSRGHYDKVFLVVIFWWIEAFFKLSI